MGLRHSLGRNASPNHHADPRCGVANLSRCTAWISRAGRSLAKWSDNSSWDCTDSERQLFPPHRTRLFSQLVRRPLGQGHGRTWKNQYSSWCRAIFLFARWLDSRLTPWQPAVWVDLYQSRTDADGYSILW